MEDKYIEFLLENTGIKNKEDILSKYQEESKFRTYCEDDKIIGFVGANIRDLNYKAREYKSTFIADSIVIKDRRREGIYTNLYREFENQVKNELMYALPLQYELINLVDKLQVCKRNRQSIAETQHKQHQNRKDDAFARLFRCPCILECGKHQITSAFPPAASIFCCADFVNP